MNLRTSVDVRHVLKQHIDDLQVLVLERPHTARALLRQTAALAHACRQSHRALTVADQARQTAEAYAWTERSRRADTLPTRLGPLKAVMGRRFALVPKREIRS
jgi:hypothetical protein